MYKDIISYELSENTTKTRLLEVASHVYNDWMKLQDGFIKWEIHENKQGGFTDLVYWATEAAAKEAEKSMMTMPHAMDWIGCYKEGSISSINVHNIASFGE